VPGKVLRLDPPLEYLAVARDGYKAYESLLELDVGGVGLNAACILVGLEAPSTAPEFQFDEEPIEGQSVALRVSWEDESGRHEVAAERLLSIQGAEPAGTEWVYIGSLIGPDKNYGAEVTGTLIGFVHDPVSVIENREGLGIGRYGSVAGNKAIAPPRGTRIWLTVINLEAPEAAGAPSN
jgi:hypothetical protein